MYFISFIIACVIGVSISERVPSISDPVLSNSFEQNGTFYLYKINRLTSSQISDILASRGEFGNFHPVFIQEPNLSKSNLILIHESNVPKWEKFLRAMNVNFFNKGVTTLGGFRLGLNVPQTSEIHQNTHVQPTNLTSIPMLRDRYPNSWCQLNSDCSPGRFCSSFHWCQGNIAPSTESRCPSYYGYYCQNRGTCYWTPSTKAVRCLCPAQTWGDRCEGTTLTSCPGNYANGYCQGGGTCTYDRATTIVSCICTPSRYGQRCEYKQ